MQVTFTVDLSKGKKHAWKECQTFFTKWESEEDLEAAGTDEDAEEAPAKKKAAKKSKPAKTVSEDEEEEFGTKGAVDEDELEDEDAEESDDDAEDEDALPWETVKEAINKYGNKKPDEMKAILLSFNFKSTKELQQHKVKWEPVYRKVMAKLKATKKAK